jgi:hypothetical protein
MHPITVEAKHTHPGLKNNTLTIVDASWPLDIPVIDADDAPLHTGASPIRSHLGVEYRQVAVQEGGVVPLKWIHDGRDEAEAMVELFRASTISVKGILWTHRYDETSAPLAGKPGTSGRKKAKKLLRWADAMESIAAKWRADDPSPGQLELVQDLERRARKARKKATKLMDLPHSLSSLPAIR